MQADQKELESFAQEQLAKDKVSGWLSASIGLDWPPPLPQLAERKVEEVAALKPTTQVGRRRPRTLQRSDALQTLQRSVGAVEPKLKDLDSRITQTSQTSQLHGCMLRSEEGGIATQAGWLGGRWWLLRSGSESACLPAARCFSWLKIWLGQ